MGLMIAIFVSVGISQAQINSYVGATDGFWDEARFWSLATPPSISQSGIFITNDISKTVTIDSITANNFPKTLTISNLTISALSGDTNMLSLSNAGMTPLHVLNGMTVDEGGMMTGSGSALVVEGTLSTFGEISVSDTYIQAGEVAIGSYSSEGVMTMDGGTMVAGGLAVAACRCC
jgi:hypothetical protein